MKHERQEAATSRIGEDEHSDNKSNGRSRKSENGKIRGKHKSRRNWQSAWKEWGKVTEKRKDSSMENLLSSYEEIEKLS